LLRGSLDEGVIMFSGIADGLIHECCHVVAIVAGNKLRKRAGVEIAA
jgi:hypothetical protein